jgi:hypothetical protein
VVPNEHEHDARGALVRDLAVVGGGRAFAAEHGIDEKKFASFEHAASFVSDAGFVIDAREGGSSRETWTLRPRG